MEATLIDAQYADRMNSDRVVHLQHDGNCQVIIGHD